MIAHEFSHVLNGDMRLNVQLMGWLFGLFVVALIGRTLLRYAPRGRQGGGRPAGGRARRDGARLSSGCSSGALLQAAVSRQRERLADASGVQFTRNPDGLKGALVKIAGLAEGSRIVEADAEQAAHMLFAPGVDAVFRARIRSLAERIRDARSALRREATAARGRAGAGDRSRVRCGGAGAGAVAQVRTMVRRVQRRSAH